MAKLIMRLSEVCLLGALVLLLCSKWSVVCVFNVLSGAAISQLRAVASPSGDVMRT